MLHVCKHKILRSTEDFETILEKGFVEDLTLCASNSARRHKQAQRAYRLFLLGFKSVMGNFPQCWMGKFAVPGQVEIASQLFQGS